MMMCEWSACDEDEDVVTMALTAVRWQVERCGVRWEDIGMLQVAGRKKVSKILNNFYYPTTFTTHRKC